MARCFGTSGLSCLEKTRLAPSAAQRIGRSFDLFHGERHVSMTLKSQERTKANRSLSFNRSIRLLASKKGMRLNQRGLYKDVIRGKNRERLTEGTLVEGESEKRIFEILGVPYREAHERNP
jgi:hypothetical protein